MIRTLMASTALLAFVTTGALAQQQPADQTQTQQPQAQQPATGDQQQAQPPQGVQQQQQQGEVLAEDLIGETVYSGQTEDAESVGDISDLVLDEQGQINAVVIGVGGFLGIGQKDVAINFEELQFSQDQDGELRIVVSATQEQLEAAPEFEETDQTRLYGGMTEEERQTARVPQQQQEPQDQQAAQQPDQQAQDQQAAQQPDQQAQDQQTTIIEPETTDQQAQDQQAAQQPDQQAQDQQMAQQPEQDSPEQQTTVIEPESADQQAQAQQGQQQDQQVAFVEAPEQGESRASDWIGKQIVTAEDEEVGEVQDLLVDENGMTEAVIVDVSGFVESEKQVAIPFDAIQIEQQDGQEDVRLVANLSQEELQQAPGFQPEQATAQRQQGQDQQAQQQDQQAQQQEQQDQQAQQQDQQSVTGGAQERQAARAPGVEQTVSGLSADQLMGANVIGANDEEIGQVNDVIFSQDGQIRAVVVDVGGFLGIGAKQVAIEFDAAQVQRQEGDELALMIPATEQQLEQAPEYQENAEMQQGQQPGSEQQPQARPDQEPGEQPRQQ